MSPEDPEHRMPARAADGDTTVEETVVVTQHFVHAAPDDDRTHPRAADVDQPVDKTVFVGGLVLTLAFVLWG